MLNQSSTSEKSAREDSWRDAELAFETYKGDLNDLKRQILTLHVNARKKKDPDVMPPPSGPGDSRMPERRPETLTEGLSQNPLVNMQPHPEVEVIHAPQMPVVVVDPGATSEKSNAKEGELADGPDATLAGPSWKWLPSSLNKIASLVTRSCRSVIRWIRSFGQD
jgi:hypothetical protein